MTRVLGLAAVWMALAMSVYGIGAAVIGLTRLRSEHDMREAGATHLCHDLLEAGKVLLAQAPRNGAGSG